MTKERAMTPAARPFTGRKMLAVVVSFFAVVIAVNIFLAVAANETWTGLVVENSYVASQHFNEELADARRQQGLGWHAALSYADGGLRLQMTDSQGLPLPDMTVTAVVQRPTHEGEDRQLTLAAKTGGLYVATAALPAGTWNAEIVAVDRLGRHYRRDFRLWVPQGA
ncbi:MAG: cytochrome oxidase [Alphaproteobacteria bacterium]|nr:cytochrome oxidase [Alphaproteobacteria bacterium]